MGGGTEEVEPGVRAAFLQQAGWCAQLGSPFTSLLCRLLGERLDRTTATGRRVLDWPGRPEALADALPLRLAGGLHALVRQGRLPALERLYPPAPLPDQDELWRAVAASLAEADRALLPWLESPPQTNETARSAMLMAGLMVLASRWRLPFALHELGASAWLNLMLDRYAFALGGRRTGDAASPLAFAPAWQGAPPPAADVRIVRRHGVDRNPLDVRAAADRARLLAYVWPDQEERLQRMQRAIAIAMAQPPPLERADAADWLERALAVAPEPGCMRVVCHSIAFQYFSPQTQHRVATHVALVGAKATPEAPVAWLQFEVDIAAGSSPTLRLTQWPGGGSEVLATANAHVSKVHWLAGGDARGGA